MTAIAIKRGDFVTVPGVGRDETHMVLSPCIHEQRVTYLCASCKQGLFNIGNVEMHLEHPGEHRICAWCTQCRTYRAIDQQFLNALTESHQGGPS